MDAIELNRPDQMPAGFLPLSQAPTRFFDVKSEPVFDGQGKAVPGWQRIERKDTGDTLHVATSSYTLVPYEQHFDMFETAIRHSTLPKDHLCVKTDVDYNGARLMRQYLFPGLTHMIEGRGDRLAFRIVMFDSYDGTSAFKGAAGFFNYVCRNECVFGRTLAEKIFNFRHVGELDKKIEEAARQLVAAGEQFQRDMPRLDRWPNIKLGIQGFSDVVRAMPQGNPTLVDELTARYGRDEKYTLWDASQLLTSWATHGINRRTATDRQKRVGMLMEAESWTNLEK